MNNKVVIVIDMLNGFAKQGALYSKNIKDIIPTIKEIVEEHDNVIFVADSHSPNDIEMKQYPLHCLTDTEEAQIVSELAGYANSETICASSVSVKQ
ncbi:cysteine hydrolase family protein, partial [Mycoplasma nasistruthionis]